MTGVVSRRPDPTGTFSRLADLDALPEGDPAGDLRGRALRLGVVPGRVPVHLAVDLEREVGGGALPGADAVRLRRAEDVAAHRLAREVRVALDGDDVVGLRDHGAVPGSSGHGLRNVAASWRIPELTSAAGTSPSTGPSGRHGSAPRRRCSAASS